MTDTATKPTRVLFVDDDAEDHVMLRDMIKAMNGTYVLDWQADYDDALAQMKRQEHDVFIVDYLLGEKNGLQLIKEAFPDGCTLPIILLTARGRRDIDESALAMGVTEYFDKADIRLPLLERAIRYAINNKKIETNLRATLAREKELSELKTRFVSMASHELRTPLTAIQTNVYMLKNYAHKLDHEQSMAKFAKIEEMVQHMGALLDDVLSLSRIVTGQFQFNPTLLQLSQFCKDMIEEFQGGAGKDHKLEYVGPADAVEVPADTRLMRQMISNLLDNAIKYSKAGSTVILTVKKETDKAILAVKDQGIGIPEADQAKLFDPFQRAGNVGSVQGSGLGLSIVKQAIDLHNGTITIQSKVGEGTTFTATLPAG
ncbi:MAG: hybrid sensor histidine kinase/response regulator [Anaerolineae bacterium]